MRKHWRLIVLAGLAVGTGLMFAYCTGVIRPPRRMFHDNFGPVGFEVVSDWKPNPPLADAHGQWLWVDMTDNILAVHATGTAESGRSKAMHGGRDWAKFRFGSAWDDERDNQYVTIPRQPDTLFVILPDGRWKGFALDTDQAAQFYRRGAEDGMPDVLGGARALLVADERAKFEEFLAGYVPPQPPGRDKE